jgi:phosphohistidine phosphatase
MAETAEAAGRSDHRLARRARDRNARHLPARRRLDTIEPHWDRRIYLASAATLIDVIRDTGRDAEHLLISGHNPGLEDLILMLVPESADDELRAKVEEKLPTSALARLELDIDDWHDLDTNSARFVGFIRPRDLDPALAPAMDND